MRRPLFRRVCRTWLSTMTWTVRLPTGESGNVLAAVALTALSIYAGCKLVRWYRFTRECRIVRITLADPMIGHPAINPYSTVEGLYHEH